VTTTLGGWLVIECPVPTPPGHSAHGKWARVRCASCGDEHVRNLWNARKTAGCRHCAILRPDGERGLSRETRVATNTPAPSGQP
jgi:hypothetical protein